MEHGAWSMELGGKGETGEKRKDDRRQRSDVRGQRAEGAGKEGELLSNEEVQSRFSHQLCQSLHTILFCGHAHILNTRSKAGENLFEMHFLRIRRLRTEQV